MKRVANSLPYNFKGIELTKEKAKITNIQLVKRNQLDYFYKNHKQFYQVFDDIHKDVLQGMAEQDTEYLQNIMEEKLYKEYIQGIEALQKHNMSLEYYKLQQETEPMKSVSRLPNNLEKAMQELNINTTQDMVDKYPFDYQTSQVKIAIQGAAVFGVKVHRNDNQHNSYWKFRSLYLEREYYVNKNIKKLSDLYYNQILVFNVYFATGRNLGIIDSYGNKLNRTDQWTLHKWRFECPEDVEDNWLLTDMDDVLQGNAYY